jgi:hypothetical protein
MNYHQILNSLKDSIKASDLVMDTDGPDYINSPSDNYERITRSVFKTGDKVQNINKSCKHYGSEGIVEGLEELPEYMGNVVLYRTTNSGPNWKKGEVLKKTEVQLKNLSCVQK